ncbi:FIVAR domain-containing protein [Lysinibacillus sp. FJAT-14745]|uniref:FIVAR domain-containing protein n=1 Tax=Lysinibacillus sp. FJAT-14745 TaxID=1704289 RepID=UPI000B029DFC|nr:FIVAR domain-containing protein [Lysinibacillus sp. FJAT-14745]
MKNKALSTFMATAITATLVLPVSPANAASNDSSLNHSIQIDGQVAEAKTKGQIVTINNITKDKVLTSNGQFKISQSLKSLLKTSNSTALANAEATIIVKNGEITSITALTLTKAGTNKKEVYFDGGGEQIDGSLTVNADYVKVQNVTIKDELIVTNRVKKAIAIDDVTIGDTITFKPLLTRNINWLNVSLKDITSPNINLERTKVNMTSDKTISKIDVVGKVTAFEVTANVDKLTIDVEKDFSLYGEGKIEQVVVKQGAKVALDSGHLINRVQVDDKKASVTLPVANKTELSKLVATPPYVAVSYNGNDILTTEKWTTQAERSVFESVVASARTVANNPNASHEQVNNAITQYKNALASYQAVQKNGTKYTYGDKSSLQSLINSIQYVAVSWNNGNDVASYTPWTTQSEKDALASAVSSAQYVVNNNYATQSDITNSISNLNYAITVYKNAQKYGTYQTNGDRSALLSLINSVQYVAVSWNNGNDVASYTPWTTQSEKDALASAVSSAQSVANNNYATQSDITNSFSNLNYAITVYKNAQKYGTYQTNADRSALLSLINSVQYVTVSVNGSELSSNTIWTTQSEKDTLVSAVSYAQSVANNGYSSQSEISSAYNYLYNAISTYRSNHKSGVNYRNYVDKSWLTSLINTVQYVKVSANEDGTDVPYYEKWTTEREKRDLEKAVQNAQSVVNNSYASSYEVTDAINSLDKAINIYKEVQRSGKQR